eukprot:scpid108601/ scgid2488/ 
MQIGTTVIVPVYHMPTSAMPMSAVPKYNYNVTPTAPPTSPTESLSVGFLNVCSVRRKVAEVQTFISTRGIHALAIAETWLTPDVSDQELSIPHFKLYRRDRPDQRGGGVAVYCHESLAFRQRADLQCEL